MPGEDAQTATSSRTSPTVLMCPPNYYGVAYEINPWMSRTRGADRRRAQRQWETLYELVRDRGAQVKLIEPQPGLPDMVFTANAGLVWQQTVFLSRFRHAVRAPEAAHFERWFRAEGFQVRRLPPGLYFEGAGDALYCGETLCAAYRFRSDVRSHHWIAEQTGSPLAVTELINPYFYHLDTCFCPLRPGAALWYPYAFDEYGRRVLERAVNELLPVPTDEAHRFACNSVVIGSSVIVPAGCPKTLSLLKRVGFDPFEVDLSEFQKAGGSAKCLTLRLDGEDAAGWKSGKQPDSEPSSRSDAR